MSGDVIRRCANGVRFDSVARPMTDYVDRAITRDHHAAALIEVFPPVGTSQGAPFRPNN
jgi:hypothetical protein